MGVTFNRIAYQAMAVCNPLDLAAVERAVARTGLPAGARVIDIGCGNGVVSAFLAERFGFQVAAVERDPAIAALARARTAAATGVVVVEGGSGEALAAGAPFDLVVALGATEAAGGGLRDPAAVFRRLAQHLAPSGWILWGDLTWTGEPPDPIRQVVEASNAYLTETGWREAAAAAGLQPVQVALSGEAAWSDYRNALRTAAEDWLSAHPEHPDAPAVRLRADRTAMMFELARPFLDFGLYLLRR